MHLDQSLHRGDLGEGVDEVVVDPAEGQLDHVDAAAAYGIEVRLRQGQVTLERRPGVAVENQRRR